MHRPVRLSTALLGAVTATGVLAGLVPGPAAAATGVCDGVSRCRVVAHVDVNGDGRRDAVGMARRGENGSAHSRVLVRVRVATDRIVTARRSTPYWYGSPWQGAATLDARRGKDLMLGYTTGAHTSWNQSLTWRKGALVPLDAPGPERHWVVDSYHRGATGWLRRAGDPDGTVRKRTAERKGETETFRGRVTRFRWTADGWDRVSTRVVDPMTSAAALSFGGFRIPGLQRW